jgi:hypothetical protein
MRPEVQTPVPQKKKQKKIKWISILFVKLPLQLVKPQTKSSKFRIAISQFSKAQHTESHCFHTHIYKFQNAFELINTILETI